MQQLSAPAARPNRDQGLIKLVAILTMMVDHMGVVFFPGQLWLRVVGRIAFPLFCFMLVEGFFHTKNKWRYLYRLVIFALISEFPFDLVNRGSSIWEQQSVMVTLSISLLVLILMDKIRNSSIPATLRGMLQFVPVAAGAVLAYFAKTDYSFKGVLVIAALYLIYPLFQIERVAYILTGGILFFWEWMNKVSRVFASLAFIPLFFYNGQKGRSAKWLFYLFYPVHLLLIYGIIRLLLD